MDWSRDAETMQQATDVMSVVDVMRLRSWVGSKKENRGAPTTSNGTWQGQGQEMTARIVTTWRKKREKSEEGSGFGKCVSCKVFRTL